MQNFILTRLARYVGGKLDGYKTLIGALGYGLMVLLGVIRQMYPDLLPLPADDWNALIHYGKLASEGMIGVGVAHKGVKAVKKAKGGGDVVPTQPGKPDPGQGEADFEFPEESGG